MASGISDQEIAGKLGVTEATIRRHRFTFREKAKQAKYYLAIYEQIFEKKYIQKMLSYQFTTTLFMLMTDT